MEFFSESDIFQRFAFLKRQKCKIFLILGLNEFFAFAA